MAKVQREKESTRKMAPKTQKRKCYTEMGRSRMLTRLQCKLNALPQESSTSHREVLKEKSNTGQGKTQKPVIERESEGRSCGESSLKLQAAIPNMLNLPRGQVFAAKTKALEEKSDIGQRNMQKSVIEPESEDSSCDESSLKLRAAIANMLNLPPGQVSSDSQAALRYHSTSWLALRDEGVDEGREIVFAGIVDKTTTASGAANDEQFPLESITQRCGARDKDVPISVPISHTRVRDASPSASSNFATGQMPVLEATATSQVADKMVEENAYNHIRHIEHPSEALSFGLTEMVGMCADDNSNSDVDFPPLVSVQGYMVREKFVPTLRNIVERHGDIAADYKTLAFQSFFLESVCELVQTLQGKRFGELTLSDIEKALVSVHDSEKAGLKVGWLRLRLEDILETKKLIKQASTLKNARDNSTQAIKEKKKILENYGAQLLALKEKLILTQKELDAAQTEFEKIQDTISNAKAKVGYYMTFPLLDELL